MLFSTFTTSILSGLFTGFVYIAGHFTPELKHFENVVESELLPKLTLVLYYLLPNLFNFDVKARVVAGDAVPVSLLGYSSLYGALYVAVVLLAATVIFSRKNLK